MQAAEASQPASAFQLFIMRALISSNHYSMIKGEGCIEMLVVGSISPIITTVEQMLHTEIG